MARKKLALLKEFEYYLKHQAKFVKQYNGKVIVIKGHKLLGVYSSDVAAISKTMKDHKLGTFLVQRCSPGNKDYTTTIHTPGIVRFD